MKIRPPSPAVVEQFLQLIHEGHKVTPGRGIPEELLQPQHLPIWLELLRRAADADNHREMQDRWRAVEYITQNLGWLRVPPPRPSERAMAESIKHWKDHESTNSQTSSR